MSSPRRQPPGLRPLSVGTQLLSVVVAIVLVFAALGAFIARGALEQARRGSDAAASFQVKLAANALEQNLQLSIDSSARSMEQINEEIVRQLITTCVLPYEDDLFPRGRVDLVLPSGHVACSSDGPGGRGRTPYSGLSWFTKATTATEPVMSPVHIDRVTGKHSVAVTSTFRSATGRPVAMAVVVSHTGPAARELARVFGGADGFVFELTDAKGTVLAGALAGDGDLVRASAEIPTTGWRLTASLPTSVALADVLGILVRVAALGVVLLLVVLALLLVIQRHIARPLQRLTAAVAAMGRQVTAGPVHVQGPAEVCDLAREFNQMLVAQAEYEQQLRHHTLHDPFTGLPNRPLLLDRLASALGRSGRSDGMVGVLSINLDGFRRINDRDGHQGGDAVLWTIASRLKDVLRPGDTLARLGGDEFLILVEELEDPAAVGVLAARVAEAVAQPCRIGQGEVVVTASIGGTVGRAGDDADDLVRDADTALNQAKVQGGARFELYDTGLRAAVTIRMETEADLRRALDHDELWVAYQPIVDLTTGTISGAEALVRWDHPTKGAIPPGRFIDVAEETGLILEIGRRVLLSAAQQAVAWRDLGTPIPVSVNVSGRQLRDVDMVALTRGVLDETGLPPELMCLEITESMLLDDPVRTLDVLTRLRDSGVRLSIDDFGTGYSSLAYLQRFPVHAMKIDRAFISALGEADSARVLVEAMLAMAHALGLTVVAEGVETEEQSNMLIAMRCPAAQGFLYARPQRGDQVTALLRQEAPAVVPPPRGGRDPVSLTVQAGSSWT